MKDNYPRDWKEYKFGDVFDLSGSLSISRANLSDEGICYLHYGDIHKSSDSFIDVNKSYKNIPKYNITLEEVDPKYLLKDGDIVFADASEDYEGIAKSLTVINKDNKPFISGLHTIVARDKDGIIDNNYKRYFLKDWEIRKQLMTLATGTSVLGISQPNLKKITVFLPPKEEQNKIGLILSKWDKAIELKEKLIEQKREQKKGLLQKLLKGEVRLPGFNVEWKEVRLGDYLIKHNEKSKYSNQYPVLTSSRKGMFLQKDYYLGNEVASDDNTGYNVVPYGFFTYRHMSDDLAFKFNINTIVEKGIVSTLYPVFTTNNLNSYFLMHKLNEGSEFKRFALKQKQGGTRTYMYFSKLEELIITIPSLEEQEGIAELARNMEKQIILLETELLNLKQQKQALMQQLLTGKIRVKV